MKKQIWIPILIIAVIIVGLVIFAPRSKNSAEKEVIKIGAILPLTGPAAWIGEQQREGIELAVKEINQNGGANGRPLQIIFEDSQGSPKEGVSAFNRILFEDPNIPAIFTSVSSVTNALIPLANEKNVNLVLVAVTLPNIVEKSKWIARFTPDDYDQIVFLTKFLAEKFSDIKKIAISYINDDYGIEAKEVFKKQFQGEIILKEAYSPTQTDFRDSLTKLKNSKADAVFIVGYTQAMPALLKQMKEMAIELPKFSLLPASFPPIIKAGGEAMEGVYCTNVTIKGEFKIKFESSYGKAPGVFGALNYDATKVLAKVIEENGLSASSIREGLRKIKDYPGVSGNITVKENGDVDYELGIVQIKEGKPVEVFK